MEDKDDRCDEVPHPQQAMREGPRKGPSRQRRKELLQLAETISVLVQEQTERRERRLLHRMVEMFLDD
jgi:hypothetical protein